MHAHKINPAQVWYVHNLPRYRTTIVYRIRGYAFSTRSCRFIIKRYIIPNEAYFTQKSTSKAQVFQNIPTINLSEGGNGLTEYDDEDVEAYRTVSMNKLTLYQGCYKKYFTPEFLSKFGVMGEESRKKTFLKVLQLFGKLDHIIKLNSSMIFGESIYGTIEQIISDSLSMMQVQNIIFYRMNKDTMELSQISVNDGGDNFPCDMGFVGKSIETKELLNIQRPDTFRGFCPEIDNAGIDSTPYSLLVLPLLNPREEVVGVIVAINKLGPPPEFKYINFNQEDEFLFKCLGNVFCAILENVNVHESMNNTQKKVTVLLETTRSLASILELDKLIKVIMDSAKELLASDRCTLFLHDPEVKQLRGMIQGRDTLQEIRIPENAGIAGAVFISGGMYLS